MNDLVSIIVPVYNVESYLKECIDSIVNQTYKNIEIILVNDGSTDSSKDICIKYKNKDKRIIFIDKINKGVSQTRNVGLDIARGRYICFIDSDDYIEPYMIEKMLKNIKQSSCDMAICGYTIFFEDGTEKKSDNEKIESIFTSREILKLIFTTNKVNGFLWNKMFDRKIIENKRMDESLDICEDLYFVCEILKENLSIHYSSQSLYKYRNINSSATMNIKKIFMKNGELKYNLVYKNIINNFSYDKEITNLIKLRNIKTVMESYYLVLKKKHKDENVDIKTLSILKENRKMYLSSNVGYKFKIIFIMIYTIINMRYLINKIKKY